MQLNGNAKVRSACQTSREGRFVESFDLVQHLRPLPSLFDRNDSGNAEGIAMDCMDCNMTTGGWKDARRKARDGKLRA
jgi:hypothetical protein